MQGSAESGMSPTCTEIGERMPRSSTVRPAIGPPATRRLGSSTCGTLAVTNRRRKPLWMSFSTLSQRLNITFSPTSYFVCQLAGTRGVSPWQCRVRRCVEQMSRRAAKRTAHVVRRRERFDCVACAFSRNWCRAVSENM